MRVIKVAAVFTLLMFIANCFVFNSIRTVGYGKTITALHPTFGSTDSLVLGLFSAASLVAIPLTAIVGLIAIASAKRLGRTAMILGVVICVLSAGSFLLWKMYGGIPKPGSDKSGPVMQKAH